MNKILLIDDNIELQSANCEFLTRKGYSIDMALNGQDALAFISARTYDCIVLDVMMPGLNGYELCALLRKKVNTPIIFLSCLDGGDSRIRGLMAGGDDYMVKPYNIEELTARIHAQIRRDQALSAHGVENPTPNALYDRESRTIAIGGMNMVLSRGECEILSRLLTQSGEIVPKRALLDLVGGEESTLKVYIMRLRNRLAGGRSLGSIENVFGEGYRYLPAKETEMTP